jgi:hypothetical protein
MNGRFRVPAVAGRVPLALPRVAHPGHSDRHTGRPEPAAYFVPGGSGGPVPAVAPAQSRQERNSVILAIVRAS